MQNLDGSGAKFAFEKQLQIARRRTGVRTDIKQSNVVLKPVS